jgi:hypothetical protein
MTKEARRCKRNLRRRKIYLNLLGSQKIAVKIKGLQRTHE